MAAMPSRWSGTRSLRGATPLRPSGSELSSDGAHSTGGADEWRLRCRSAVLIDCPLLPHRSHIAHRTSQAAPAASGSASPSSMASAPPCHATPPFPPTCNHDSQLASASTSVLPRRRLHRQLHGARPRPRPAAAQTAAPLLLPLLQRLPLPAVLRHPPLHRGRRRRDPRSRPLPRRHPRTLPPLFLPTRPPARHVRHLPPLPPLVTGLPSSSLVGLRGRPLWRGGRGAGRCGPADAVHL